MEVSTSDLVVTTYSLAAQKTIYVIRNAIHATWTISCMTRNASRVTRTAIRVTQTAIRLTQNAIQVTRTAG